MGASYEYYRIFYYVSKYKNFTKAAYILMTSQPAVTRSIQNLENELGCQLFVRNKRGVDLTHEGRLLYEYVSAGCEQFMKGEAKVTGTVSLQNGIIYLGVNETSFSTYVMDVLNEFHTKYPYVKLKISNVSTKRALEDLKDEILDLAIIKTPTDISRPLKETKIKSFQDILICSNKYASLCNKKIRLKELSNYPIICPSKGTKSYDFWEAFFSKHNMVLVPDFEVNTFDMMLHLVLHDFGIGFIPESFALQAIKHEELFQINLYEKIPARNICMVVNTEHAQSKLSKELQRMIMNTVSKDTKDSKIT